MKNMLNLKNISLLNPWYQNNNFLYQEKKFSKRKYYYEVQKYLKKELIISIVGLRRTGKTTIIKQLINYLLLKKIETRKIFFYQFDDDEANLEKLLEFYFKNILKTDLYKSECFIFLDELQFIENWQSVLKKYYDINPKIKFVISGSTHLYLHKNTKESLAGRIADIYIHTFGWHDFLNFKYNKNFNFLSDIFSDNFLYKAKKNSDILIYKEEFLNFLSFGEYPYYFHEVDVFFLDKYYKESILDKIFTKDISLFDIDNRKAFSEVFKILNKETGQEINLTNLSREIGLNVITIKRYISILEKMFLHDSVYKYEKSLRKQIRSFKKGYVKSLNLARVLIGLDYFNISKDEFGHLIETFVYNEFIKNNIKNINFYHDTKTKKEVDFILRKGDIILPIEVKTNHQINKKNLKNLIDFMKKNKCRRGILVYGGNEVEVKNIDDHRIEFIPYFLI